MKLSTILYSKKDIEGYLNELNSFASKFFIKDYYREMMKIDAYIINGDKEAIEGIVEKLNSYKLTPVDEFVIQEKLFTFYASIRDVEKLRSIQIRMIELNENIKVKDNSRYTKSIEESKYVIAILEKDGRYYKELAELAENNIELPFVAGSYYYKAAQSAYYLEKMNDVESYLKKASPLLEKTIFEEKIKKMLDTKDFSALDE